MNKVIKYVLVLLMVMVFLPLAGAEAQDSTLKVTPGNYLIKRKTSSDADPNAIEKNEEKCITDPVFNPVDSIPKSRGCTASNIKKNGTTVTFDITCTGGTELPPFNGTAEYNSNGVAIGWKIVFKGESNGKSWTIIDNAEGKRIGDCKPQ